MKKEKNRGNFFFKHPTQGLCLTTFTIYLIGLYGTKHTLHILHIRTNELICTSPDIRQITFVNTLYKDTRVEETIKRKKIRIFETQRKKTGTCVTILMS